jgi:hypothetical protein
VFNTDGGVDQRVIHEDPVGRANQSSSKLVVLTELPTVVVGRDEKGVSGWENGCSWEYNRALDVVEP